MITNFQGKKIPKERPLCKCFSIMILDSVVKAKKKFILKHFGENANMSQKI